MTRIDEINDPKSRVQHAIVNAEALAVLLIARQKGKNWRLIRSLEDLRYNMQQAKEALTQF